MIIFDQRIPCWSRFRARNAKTPQLQVNAGNLHAFTGARSACKTSNATAILPWRARDRHVQLQQNNGNSILDGRVHAELHLSVVSLAGGTVRKSKSNLVFLHRFLIYAKSGSTELACANEHAREPTSKLQSPRCADGERTPFQSVRMMCVGGSSCRWTRGRSMIIDRQGER